MLHPSFPDACVLPDGRRDLLERIGRIAALTRPGRVQLCDGSERERAVMKAHLAASGALNAGEAWRQIEAPYSEPVARGGGAMAGRAWRAQPKDVAPADRHSDPSVMRARLDALFADSMAGRTMYVAPFLLNQASDARSIVCLGLTDAPAAVLATGASARLGAAALEALDRGGECRLAIHALGAPLRGEARAAPACVVDLPERREVWLLGRGAYAFTATDAPDLALQVASGVAREAGWLAEHMVVWKITSASGQSRYIAEVCQPGTSFGLAQPALSLEGWTFELTSRGAAWLRQGADGGLYAAVADRDVSRPRAAARPARGGAPTGVDLTVPISAVLFSTSGGRAAPLVTEAFSWSHGVFLACALAAIAPDTPRPGRFAPGQGEHVARWLDLGERIAAARPPPRLYVANWARQDLTGRSLWPGGGDNIRVLKWIAGRLDGSTGAQTTPLGKSPGPQDLDVSGLGLGAAALEALLAVNPNAWRTELRRIRRDQAWTRHRLGASLGDHLAALEDVLR